MAFTDPEKQTLRFKLWSLGALVIASLLILLFVIFGVPRLAGAGSSPPSLKTVLRSFSEHLVYAEIRFEVRGEPPRTVRLREAKTLPDALFFFWSREGGRFSWSAPEIRGSAWFLRGERNPGPLTASSLPCPVLEIRVVAFAGPRYVPEQMYCLQDGERVMSLTFLWVAEGGRLRPKTIHVVVEGTVIVVKVLEVKSASPRKAPPKAGQGGRK